MSKIASVALEKAETYLENSDYLLLAEHLQATFKVERNEEGVPQPFEFSLNAVNFLKSVLAKFVSQSIQDRSLLNELFRSLRNYVINKDVQLAFSNDDMFLSNVKELVKDELEPESAKLILQFLINLIVSNQLGASKVYNIFQSKIFNFMLRGTCVYESSALLYNMSLFQELNLSHENVIKIIELYDENNIEFLCFLIENLITKDLFWQTYLTLDIKNRLIVLEMIRGKQIKGEDTVLPDTCIKILIEAFVKSANIIFQTISSNNNDLEPYEVTLLLEITASLSGTEKYLPQFKNSKDLLINTGVILINIHRLGKESENYFSSIQSLSDLRKPAKEISEHPAFGFKAHLIRIVGNLCWKNKAMQDLAREAELIPVVLDCCNMDARNPFIMQWAILAVRNLCDGNLENQKIIAELHQEGTVSSTVLTELGVTLHSDGDNSLRIVPLERSNNK